MKYLIFEQKQLKKDLVFMNNFSNNKINYENTNNYINNNTNVI